MKPIEEQDHYEVLELPYGARPEDIRRAYPIVRGAYEEESLATYSVFRPDEVELIRERIDVAYRVLTDDDARRLYDEQIGVDPDLQQFGDPAVAVDSEPSEPAVEIVATLEALDDLDELDDDEGLDWDGARLRRARLRRGIEIDQIAEITKINPMYLRAIESSAYGDLPAAVYTRGFVTAYSRTIGIDPEPVARSFMAKFEDARSDRRSSGLLAGRR
jgi:flagellar biosynthesis protein FlhG